MEQVLYKFQLCPVDTIVSPLNYRKLSLRNLGPAPGNFFGFVGKYIDVEKCWVTSYCTFIFQTKKTNDYFPVYSLIYFTLYTY